MYKWTVALLVVALAASIGPQQAIAAKTPASLKVAVHGNMIEHVQDVVLPIIIKKLKEELPKKNFADGIPSKIKKYCIKVIGCFRIKSIKATSVHINPKSRVMLRDQGFLLTLKGIGVHVKGGISWDGDHVTLKAGASGLSLTAGVSVTAVDGRPKVQVKFASLGIRKEDIYANVKGLGTVLDWVVNSVSGWCKGIAVDAIRSAFTEHFTKIANTQLGPLGHKVPLSYDIPAATLDKALPMKVKNGISIAGKLLHTSTKNNLLSLDIGLTPKVRGRDHPLKCSVDPSPAPGRNNKMLEIHIDEHLPCSVLETVYNLGIMKWSGYVDNPAIELPNDNPIVGKADGVLAAVFANYKVAYSVEASKPPEVSFREKGGVTINIATPYSVWLVNKKTNKRKLVISSVLGILGLVRVGITDNKISYKVGSVRPTIYQMKTFMPEIDPIVKNPLNDLVRAIVEEKALAKINGALSSRPYEIPVLPGLHFENPQLLVRHKHLVVNTNVKLDGKEIEKMLPQA